MTTSIQGPRPYPYPRPIPPPPIPHELADPISCYKCHSPSIPLPSADSSQVYAAESYYRQVLTSTWRTQIDQIEAVNLANELEAQGLLERWVEQLLEEGLDPTKLGEKSTIEESREGIKEAVRIVTSKEQMEVRMERVLKRTMESVLVRMLSLGYGAFCFHDLLQSSPHATVPTYTPLPPIPTTSASSFSLGILRSTASNRLPTFKTRLREARLTPDDLATLLTDSYPLWRGLLIECAKREHHKSMYDVQLMMVGGFSIKLLELAWRELRIDRTRGRTVESEKRVGFSRVVRWCEMGGVRIALWEKGEKERMEKERKREVERLVIEEQRRKEREKEEKEERKKRERTERRRKRDQERYEEVLGRLVAIDKERRALLEESLTLETERAALETKLNPNSNNHHLSSSPATTRPSTPASTIAESDSGAPPSSTDAPPPPTTTVDAPPPSSSPAPTEPIPPTESAPDSQSTAIAHAELELRKAEERVKIAERIENVFQRMVDNPATGSDDATGGKKGGKGAKGKQPPTVVKPFVPPPVPRPIVPTTTATAAATKKEVNGSPSIAPKEKEKDVTKPSSSSPAPSPSPAPAPKPKEEQVDMPSTEIPSTTTTISTTASDAPPTTSTAPAAVAVAVEKAAPPPSTAEIAPLSSPAPVESTTAPLTTTTTTSNSNSTPPPSSAPAPTDLAISWAQKVSTAHQAWIPPSGASVRRTAVRRLRGGGAGSVVQGGWERFGLGPGGEGLGEEGEGGSFGAESGQGEGVGVRLVGEEEDEFEERKEGSEGGEFVQGCSQELEWIWKKRERERDCFWRKSRAGLEWKGGKGKERMRELECTCGGNWEGERSDSPAPRRRKKARQPRTTTTSRSTSVDARAAASPTTTTSAPPPTSNSDTPPPLPHICPIDVHTPDPHAPDDWTPPLTIHSSISGLLSQAFLLAYNAALTEVNNQQLVQLFQSSIAQAVGKVWELGGEPGRFVRGMEGEEVGSEERKAMESVVGEIVCVTAKKEYHDRVAKLALRVALPRVVKEVWKSLRSSLPRETRSTQPPCLCLISAQSWILHEYLSRHSTPPPSTLPYYEPHSTLSTHSIYTRLASSPAEVERMEQAHAHAFDLFARRAVRVNAAEFASVKHVIKLLTAQGGAAVWRMATKQMAALEALEADTFSPLNAWETVVEDVGVRAEEQVFRKENDTVQNKIIFEDVTAPWGSLTGLNTGHPTDPEACVFDLTVATTVRPDLPRPYLARAIARLKIDRPWHNSEIIYDASMALALSPPLSPAETAVAFRVRAAAYSKQCRLKEAYQDFRRDTESKASVTATALLRNSLPGARITLPGFLRPPKSRARVGKTVCHPGRCCMPAGTTNDLNLLRPLDQPILEAYLAAVRYEAHLSYQREIHRLITESVFGSLLFDESDIDDKDAIKDVSSYFWYRDLESYFQHTATKVFPEELRKNMESWLSTDWYQEHMQETLERAAFRLAEDWLYVGNEKQCLCTLNANPETLTRLETARVTYNSLSDAVRRPTAISSSDLASLHQDIQSELAEGKRTSEFWTKGGWEESVNKAAAHGFEVLSKVIEQEEKEGKLQWIDQYDGVVKILRHLSGVLIYQSIASAPTFSRRRKVGEVDDLSAWVAVALDGRDLTAESATLIEDMGDVLYGAEDGDRALQEYSEAIAIHRTPNALMQRVRLIKKLAPTDDADEKADRAQLIVRDCSQAIVLQPTNADAFAARAEALFELEHYFDSFPDLFALHHLAPDHPTILLLAHQVDDALIQQSARTQDPDVEGVHGPLPALYNRLRTSLTSVTPFKTSRPTPLAKRADPSFVDSDAPADSSNQEATPAPATTTTTPTATAKAATTNKEIVSRRDAAAASDVAAYNAALARQQKGAAPPKPTMPLSYYPDPRCACPPIRCSGAVPVVENFDRLDELLLEIFLMSHKIELAERRPLSFAAIRDTLLRQYILTPGWEKGDVNSPAQRTLMETLSNDLLTSGYENGTARADRGLESWLNATLLAIKSLPIHRGTANSRDCCICLLSGNLDHVQVVHSVLVRKVEQLSDDPITLPRPDLAGLLVYCRGQIKAGTLVARGGIWRSAPKWRFEVEKLAGVFEQVFEDVVRKFNYKAFEDDYPQIAKLVGGLATFEAAHRLLLHPDPPEPGTTKRAPLAVEDVLGWAAFVSANAPYEGDGDLSKLGDVKTIGLATAKVDEATKLFRDAKYLEAIRAYSIAAIWACDRSGKETPGAERKYLRDEARRTLKSGIYAQLSYLRTLFPSNRQWMSAVADATLAIACSQKAELPAALDLRSTALHGIRHYKYALSDLEDAARLDPIKGVGWEDRLSEMRRLVPVASRIISRFSTRLDAVGPIPIDFQEPDVPKSGCPRPGCTGESCSGEDSHVIKAKDAVTRFANDANGTNGSSQADHEDEEGEETFDHAEASESGSDDAHPLTSYVLCPDPRLACPPHRCSGIKPTEANIDRLDQLLLDLFLTAHTYELANSSMSSFLVHRHNWMLQFLHMSDTLTGLTTGDSEWMERHASKCVQEWFDALATPRGRVSEGWRYWLDAGALVFSMLSPAGREDSDPTTSCVCELSSGLDRVQAALDVTAQKASKVKSKLPPRLATLDVPAVISLLRGEVANGTIRKQGIWATESKWTVKAAELIMIFGACFDRVYAKLDINAYATAMPKIARFLGGVATYSTATRLSNWLVPSSFEQHETSGWPAFAEEYAESYLAQGELTAVPERERAALAEEQDRKAQKSGGDEILAIRAFAIKSIWLGHLNFPLRDDDGARDDLFCTYAAVAKLRMRLATKRQFDEAVFDFTAALGYLNSATIRLNRAEALSRIGGLDDVAAKDVLEARSVGNFSGRELPAWEAALARRLKELGQPELFELHVRTTDGTRFISNGSNGFLDVVDVPKSLEPAETSLQDVVESAVAAIDQSLSSTAAATDAANASSLPDPRLACSPDRHDVGAEPSPSNLNQVDIFLLDIFLEIHQQMLHKLHPGRLAETRELFLQDFVRRRNGWEKAEIETSSTMRKLMRDGIKTALGEMFTSSVLAGFGLEAVVHSLAAMAVTISSHFEASGMTPCICTLTKSIPFLQKTLAELKEATTKLPPMPAPAPTDLADMQAHCRAQIKTGALSGGIWRSNPVWRKKLASLVTVFDQVFNEVVDNDWEGAEAARCGEYEQVARMVGGIAVWDRALRVDQEMKVGGWKIEETDAGNGGREVEAVAGWMCFVGTGGAASRYEVEGETEATRRARWMKVRDERIRLGNVELNNNEPKRALREFSVAALFVPDDPTIYVLMARARLALNDKTQFHEVIADCTLGLSRCSVPAPSLPATVSERERAISTKPALSLDTTVAVRKAKAAAPSDPTAYTRADLLLLRAKALVAVERFGLALYDLEALSSSLRREHTAEADAMIQSIKTWISQEQRGLEELRKEAADAAEHLHGHCRCCDGGSGESGEGGEEELGDEAEENAEAQV